MAVTRLPRTFEDLAVFTRPGSATYEDAGGVIQTAGPNEPRFEYLAGVGQGLKFGDEDLLEIPLGGWWNSEQGIFVIRCLGQPGEIVAQSGAWIAEGVDGWKTYVHKWSSEGEGLSDPVQVFPLAPNDGIVRYCAGLTNYVLNIPVEDIEIMTELNEVVNWEGW